MSLQHKKAKGERIGTTPYGYCVANDGVLIVPNESEQQNVRLIQRLHAEQKSLRQIRTELETLRVSNRAGNVYWRLDTISAIIKRERAA